MINNKENLTCEYLVIGSGAGGSTACKYLTDKGKDVILIEEGKHFKVNEFKGSMAKSLLNVWRNAGVTPIISKSNFGFGEGRCLGGGTYVNGGLMWRTPKIILDLWNKILSTKKFDSKNLDKYFFEIENILEMNDYNMKDYTENKDSIKLTEIGKKFKINVVDVPKSINSTKIENKLLLGSPAQTENSVLQKFIYPSIKKGLKLITDCKVDKLVSSNNKIISVEATLNKKKIYIYPKKIILACGATQTPMLIKKSFGNNFLISEMSVHLNFRIGVKFNEKMFAARGIMFTKQIQEYLDDGVLIMPTSFNKSSFFSSIAKMNNLEISKISQDINFYSNFVIQVQSKNKVNIKNLNNNMILTYKLNLDDLNKIIYYFETFCGYLFDTGAEEILLPLKKNFRITKNINWKKFIQENVLENNLEMVSVHGTSSAKMGNNRTNKEIFDTDGQSFDYNNLYCLDSSVLPTSTIESPQATIMAVARHILQEIS